MSYIELHIVTNNNIQGVQLLWVRIIWFYINIAANIHQFRSCFSVMYFSNKFPRIYTELQLTSSMFFLVSLNDLELMQWKPLLQQISSYDKK